MRWLKRLLGTDRSASLNVTEATTQQKKIAHRQRNAMVIEQLHELGVQDGQALRLEFFFYADRVEAADGLYMSLQREQYEVELAAVPDNKRLFVVTGWTTPISVSLESVNEWCDRMNDLGLSHHCEFDGWGTTPEQ